MYVALEPEWAGTLLGRCRLVLSCPVLCCVEYRLRVLGFVAVLFMPIPFLFYRYGDLLIRRNSRYTVAGRRQRQRVEVRGGVDLV